VDLGLSLRARRRSHFALHHPRCCSFRKRLNEKLRTDCSLVAATVRKRFHPRLDRDASNSPALPFSRVPSLLSGQTHSWGGRDMSQSCHYRPGTRTQPPNDRKGNDCGQRCDFGRAARPQVRVELERQFGPRTRVRLKERIVSVPSRSLAEEAV